MPRPSTRRLAVEIPRIIEVQAVGKSAKRSQLPAVLLFWPTSASRCAIAPVSISDQPRKQLILEENPKYFLNARHRGTAPELLVHPSCTPQMCRLSWQCIPFDALAHQLSIQPG